MGKPDVTLINLAAASARCEHGACITCSDEAVAVRVLQLLDGGTALVEVAGRTEEISVELIDAAVGDIVLAHAKVAIAKVHQSG